MPFRVPHGAEREYLATYGIVAIYVAALPSGPTLVGISRDLHRSLQAIRRRWFDARIIFSAWVKDRTEATLIAREVNRVLPHSDSGLLAASARDAQRRVENVAAHMGITLTDHDTVMVRVRAAVNLVAGMIDAAQANGDLAWFNTAYRAWRIEAKAQGRVMTYGEARARLRRVVVCQLLDSGCHAVTGALIPKIFPPLEH
jgi:hypothetical protein